MGFIALSRGKYILDKYTWYRSLNIIGKNTSDQGFSSQLPIALKYNLKQAMVLDEIDKNVM